MKHESKTWYSCDRCGVKIDAVPSNVIYTHRVFRHFMKPCEFEALTAEKKVYISDAKIVTQDVLGVDFVASYDVGQKRIHLCGKCRKDFEGFMRNE